MGDDRSLQKAHQRMLDELVPLSVAATVAYFYLADARTQLRYAGHLEHAVDFVALAISQVAPLRSADAVEREMSAREVTRYFIYALQCGPGRPDLDRVLIRRADLHGAIKALKEALTEGWERAR
jgi:hypothetical protein